MLRLSLLALPANAVVASLRAPNQFYLGGRPRPDAQVGYNWGTAAHSAEITERHHTIVRAVSAQLRARLGIPVARTFLMGFSQPVGLNYRFIGTYPEESAGGVIAICGGVPRDWEEPKYHRVTAPILHIARSEDEFFPESTARGFPDRLRVHAENVEFHMLSGGHRFPSKARAIIGPWIGKWASKDASKAPEMII